MRFPLASLTAIFYIPSGRDKCLSAVSADTFTGSVRRRFLTVEFCPAVLTAEQSVCPSGFKFFSAALADQLERLTDGVFTSFHHLIAFTDLDTMPVQGSLSLFFLRRQFQGRKVEPPNELQIDLRSIPFLNHTSATASREQSVPSRGNEQGK